ncbi:Hypothetical protein SCLAV_3773 [Streptomyces clavuligerus]|uniref:Uncharacterized protein n=1 Tax=Streptomyces clavuligerus TaxID=1901 RepID=B5H3R5_STRCL|nr:hypothetical protein SSCG_06239 [Streptomyces clavuligerus]EFG08845.1 Hypothetical protein SCLAV_3773 [Streptomyces clavuligerus]
MRGPRGDPFRTGIDDQDGTGSGESSEICANTHQAGFIYEDGYE